MTPSAAKSLFTTFMLACFALIFVVVLDELGEIEIEQTVRDVSEIADIHPFAGILSSLGILLWSVPTTICLFVATNVGKKLSKEDFMFLVSSALLSGWLLFDDLFLFHEELASRYLGLGEKVVILALGITVLLYLFAFKEVILKTKYLLLIVSLSCFAASILVDTLFREWLFVFGVWRYFIEDSFKWLGIAFWCRYHISTANQFFDSANKISASR